MAIATTENFSRGTVEVSEYKIKRNDARVSLLSISIVNTRITLKNYQ